MVYVERIGSNAEDGVPHWSAVLRRFVMPLAFAPVLGCIGRGPAPAPRAAADTTAAVSARVVTDYLAAYNRHDVPAMLGLVDSAVTWMSIAGDSVRIEARGAEALRRSLEGYFRSVPSARSTIDSIVVLGPWVTMHERAHWTGASGPRSQSAVAVYEVRDGRIRRVWYFPAVRS